MAGCECMGQHGGIRVHGVSMAGCECMGSAWRDASAWVSMARCECMGSAWRDASAWGQHGGMRVHGSAWRDASAGLHLLRTMRPSASLDQKEHTWCPPMSRIWNHSGQRVVKSNMVKEWSTSDQLKEWSKSGQIKERSKLFWSNQHAPHLEPQPPVRQHTHRPLPQHPSGQIAGQLFWSNSAQNAWPGCPRTPEP